MLPARPSAARADPSAACCIASAALLAGVDEDAAYFSPEEEQLYTTPLRLLQAIDLYLSHLAGSGGTAPRGSLPALAGGGLGLSAAQLQVGQQCRVAGRSRARSAA